MKKTNLTRRRTAAWICIGLSTLSAPGMSALSRSYTVDDLTSGKWLPSESIYKAYALGAYTSQNGSYAGYFINDLLTDIRTVGLSFEKQGSDILVVKGMFGGLLDLPFTWNGSTLRLRTNATAGGDAVYRADYPPAYPNVKKVILSPVDFDSSKSYYYFTHTYKSGGWTSDAMVEVEDTRDENGLYDLSIGFNMKAVELQITYTDNTVEKIYVDNYNLDLFKPTASISDTEIKDGNTTPRSYRGEFAYLDGNTFQMTNLGGRYAGVAPDLESGQWIDGYWVPQAYFSNINYFTGSYDLGAGTAILNTVPYSAELSGKYTYGQAYKQVYFYSVREQTGTDRWQDNVRGTVTPLAGATSHKGSTRWMTNGGDCTTWTRLEFSFNPWQAVNLTKNSADASVGLIKDTKIVPDKEVEITLGVDILNDISISHANEADAFLTATVPFVITKNEHFPVAYEVYVHQGKATHYSQIDMDKAQLIGTVPYSQAANGQYSVTGTFRPVVNVNPGELFREDYTFFVRAIYGTQHNSQRGVRMAKALEPTHHDLTSVNFAVTVGVDGINADSNIKVIQTPAGVLVEADKDIPVEVYNATGALVASGVSNKEIPVSAKGVLIVKAGTKVSKLMR